MKNKILGLLWGLLACILITLLFGSCKTVREVERTNTVHDTVYVYHNSRDSVYHKDSIFLHEYVKGDTVYVLKERWNTLYRDRLQHDTMYVARRDTIQNITIEQKKPMSNWQYAQMYFGRLCLLFLVAFAITVIVLWVRGKVVKR
jgi:hypothetical protein